MEVMEMYNKVVFPKEEVTAIVKGFTHAIALPVLFAFMTNVLIGICWVLFVSYLYRNVFNDESKDLSAFWFYIFVYLQIVGVLTYLIALALSSM